MATSQKLNRAQQKSGDQALLDGLKGQEQTLSSFTVANSVVHTADVVAMLQKRIASADAVQPAKATWHDAVQAAQDARTSTEAVVSGVRRALLVMFGTSTEKLAVFGLTPRKTPAPRTAEQKAAAAAKAKATRAARHTMGTNQKKTVKGNVVGVTVTPVVTESPATTPANPASAAPAAAAPVTAPRVS